MNHRWKKFTFASRRLASSIRYGLLGHLLMWISGCVYIPKAGNPLHTISHSWTPAERQERLLIYLPGRGDKATDFESKGLWSALKARQTPFDAVAVDAHLGYYLKRSVVDRILEDVIRPARAEGYQEIWVLGNSLGGLGALLVEQERPGTWDGMYLLAPFLGDDKNLYREFEQSGDVRHWEPGGEFGKTDFSPLLWLWLRTWPNDAANRPEIYLGYGDRDRLRLGIDHLVPLLPADHSHTIEGGHNWPTWTRLWDRLLKKHPPHELSRRP